MEALRGPPLVLGTPTPASLTRSLLAYVFGAPGRAWWTLFALACLGLGVFAWALYQTFIHGVGTWGVNVPVAWGFAIINFVWWIGIGHAGTLISAILFLFQQRWRTSINRFAEAMTLFAILQAAMFPLLHLGRPWLFYYLAPYPSTLRLWPQFRSALPWDFVAVSTYGLVSLIFWYLGLIPDLAAARDTAKPGFRQRLYALFALGWRHSARHWHHYKTAYLLLAGLATPLVLSVHSVVSFDFAITNLPGWHTTIFPPYFVAGAIFSGLAMVLLLMVPARAALGFEQVITARHIDNLNKLMLATGLMVAYGYVQEHFFAWYSGNVFEEAAYAAKRWGPYAPLFWGQIACNVAIPQLLWFERIRRSLLATWLIALVVVVGMWLERFTIVVVPLSHDFLPSSWGVYVPSPVDLGLLVGTLSLFAFLFLLFLKVIPPVPIHEVKEVLEEVSP
ncbi:MAG: polysulfide reductase NrfD [Myxococcaceae bacterium]|nr:polysulfide reductase NrfD [Myxococcaceae bacterium]